MSLRRITRVAMGIALFVALSLCLQVPIFQNYYLCLGYFVMAVYLYCFGIFDGTVVGVAGVVLYCLITSGLRGMPGWSFGNLVIGLILGGWFHVSRQYRDGRGAQAIGIHCANTLAAVISVLAGILIGKSFIEVLLYHQPMAARMATNTPAAIADAVTLIVAAPLAKKMEQYLYHHHPTILSAR